MSLPSLPDVPRERRSTATIIAVSALGALCLLGLVVGLRGLFSPGDSREPTPGAAPKGQGSVTSQGGGADAPSSAASPTGGGDSATASTATPPSPAADVVRFASPTGNIRCELSSSGARCDIADRSWTPTAKPADCSAQWGHGLFVDAQRAGLACVGSALDGGKKLAYGHQLARGDFTCSSTQDGVTCRSGGHAFTVARASYKVT